MREWLVICLRAPLASFGDNAGNAERDTSDLPTRSALIGLAAAALGIEREDGPGQTRLARELVTAAGLYERGHPLADFHTFQSLNQAGKGAATRAEALSKTAHLETSISRRHYRADGLWQAAYRLSGNADDGVTLETLRQAFEAPRFALYLGRKSCPLSHPLAPRILAADTVVSAFRAQFEAVSQTAARRGTRLQVVSVEQENDGPASNRSRVHTRHDDPRDRSKRWTFGDRPEWRFTIAPDNPQEGQA
ncbi:type I-E CRISPR-associated protein Cas5/CasD [Agrobacterium sp. a22-2]|uniref:type I-E CRISPR-associated protein Cas5/CasD n=1 Tax=Agrobacterium sp. a22-2 TaxID=2283840 RepID=UPI0014464995|nr:type I-E CRISPR-associated protein Cas5/CasD [Agrobacterium sp. a22-2]NKN38469.1 type I-E CRISPR-associated protein Cas5/CasD [Agrobacterium sp. a22-2]